MNVLAIVAEYNPFHKGHAYHLEEAKKAAQADYSLALMSSNFLQRGQPAIFNKWQRAQMAISNGLDLVIELPCLFSARSAWYYAYNSLYILEASGLVSHLAFGSEDINAQEIERLAEYLSQEDNQYKSLLKEKLKEGLSFPAAREHVLKSIFPDLKIDLNQPNLILAINYLKAIKSLNSSIKPLYIERIGSYHGSDTYNEIASASYIRKLIQENNPQYKNYLPDPSLQVINNLLLDDFKPLFIEDFSREIVYSLRSKTPDQLKELLSVAEGLENRIIKSLRQSRQLDQIALSIKSKRYTESRINRIMTESLLNMTKDLEDDKPLYIRPLAFNSKGRELLQIFKESSSLELINKLAPAYRKAGKDLKKQIDFEIRASNIYSLAQDNPRHAAYNQEFTASPLYLPD